MQKRLNKKGLSEVITSLIIILLVFVAIGIVWVVVVNILKGASDDVSIEQFSVQLKIDKQYTKINADTIEIKVQRKAGEGNLAGIKFIIEDENGAISVNQEPLNVLEGKPYIIPLNGLSGNPTKISIAPIFNSSNGKTKDGNIADFQEFDASGPNLNNVYLWLPLDGNFQDISREENSGTQYGNIGFTTDPIRGKVLNLLGPNVNPTNDYLEINVTKNPELQFGTNQDFTILLWVKTNYITNNRFVFDTGYTPHQNGISFYGTKIAIWTPTEIYCQPGIGLPSNDWRNGQWYHFAFAANRTENKITAYRNGVSVCNIQIPTNFNFGTNPIVIGAQTISHGYPFNGQVDDFRIYSRALSQQEINAIKAESQ